jgi:hypothetical protein
MIRDAFERSRGFLISILAHAVVCAVALVPIGSWFAGAERVGRGVRVQRYVPLYMGTARAPEGSGACDSGPCAKGAPPKPAPAILPAPKGSELQFVDDSTHQLLLALAHAGGWIAFVLPSDRWRAIAFYRVSDQKNLGTGASVAAYPIRVVVQEPRAYPEIIEWLAPLGLSPESVRVLAVFPAGTQQLLEQAIEAEARRKNLPIGRRRAVLAISGADPIGIEVQSVAIAADLPRSPISGAASGGSLPRNWQGPSPDGALCTNSGRNWTLVGHQEAA